MRRQLAVVTCACLGSSASAQAVHHGYVWIEGPGEVLRPNTTYSLVVWGGFESPDFVPGTSIMAGYAVGIHNALGYDSVASVQNIRFIPWNSTTQWRNEDQIGDIVGHDITEVWGAQLPYLFEGMIPDRGNPLPLFAFDFTTASRVQSEIRFIPTQSRPDQALAFYHDFYGSEWVGIPDDPRSELHLTAWTSTVPGPTGMFVMLGLCAKGRRKRRTGIGATSGLRQGPGLRCGGQAHATRDAELRPGAGRRESDSRCPGDASG